MMTSKETDAMWAQPTRVELGCQTRGQCFCTGRCRRTAEEQAAHEERQRRQQLRSEASTNIGSQEFEPKPGHGPCEAVAMPTPEQQAQIDKMVETYNAEHAPKNASALDTQVGGDHYKKLKIQPMQYSMANGLDACQHSVVRYVTRFRDKGGIQDLEKAKHCIDMLIELETRGGK